MVYGNMHYYNRFKYTLALLINLTIFAIAFGYIEGTIAHYLRLLYYPEGFFSELKILDTHIIFIEMGREFATLVIIFTITQFTKGPFYRKLANFIYIFALWDICYYAALYLFEKWPSSFFVWDVLFLLPVPWFAPVIAPITISFIGILGALIIQITYVLTGKLKFNWKIIALLSISLLLWLISFLIYPSKIKFPKNYNWFLFYLGIFLSLIGYLYLIIVNFFKKNI
jgi:hypothetical protein